MKYRLLACALVGFVPLFVSGAASATLLEFTPGNLGVAGGNEYNAVSMTVDGIGVDITAYTIANNGSGVISSKTQISGLGVGVYVKGGTYPALGVRSNTSGDGYNMDGGRPGSANDPDEGLMFSFSEVVSLNYINFDRFGKKDDFNLTVDGVSRLVDFGPHDSSSLASMVAHQHDEYNFSGVVGQNFLFWADGKTDSFRVDRMKVSAVPEPASLLLLGAGLVGFGFARRKTPA